jgi:hypothetical protein
MAKIYFCNLRVCSEGHCLLFDRKVRKLIKSKAKCILVQTIVGVEVYLYPFMTTALEGLSGQQHAPAVLYPRERPDTHCTGVWVGPKAGLDRCGNPRPHRDSIPGSSSP